MSKQKTPPYNLSPEGLFGQEPAEPSIPAPVSGQNAAPGGDAKTERPAPPKRSGQVKPALKNRIDRLFLDIREEAVDADEDKPLPPPPPPSATQGPKTRPVFAVRREDTLLPIIEAPGRANEPVALKPAESAPGRLAGSSPLKPAGAQPDSLVSPDYQRSAPGLAQPGPLTDAGRHSLDTRRPVYVDRSVQPGPESPDAPAVMAVPFGLHRIEDLTVETNDSGINLGLLEIMDNQADRFWSEDEKRLVEQVADQLSLALENANLIQRTQNALEEVENRRQIADSLRKIANLVGASLELHEVVERLLDQLPNLIPFNRATIQLAQDGWRQLLGGRGFDVALALQDPASLLRPIASDPLISEVYASKKPLLLSDTHNDPRWESDRAGSQVSCWLAAPMVAAGEVVGFLLLDNDQKDAYTQETADLAMAFASQAALAIRNARLFQQVQDTLAETDALYQASAELNSAQTYQQLLDILHESSPVLRHPALTDVFFGLFDTPWQETSQPASLVKIAQLKLERALSQVPAPAAPGQVSIRTWMRLNQYLFPDRPFVIEDQALLDDDALVFFSGGAESLPGCVLTVPLSVGGQWIGLLAAVYDQPVQNLKVSGAQFGLFAPRLLRPLEALASQAAVAVQNIHLLEETRQRAAQLEKAYEMVQQSSAETAQRAQELSTIYDMTQSISGAQLKSQEIGQIIADRFVNLTAVDRVTVFTLETQVDEAELAAVKLPGGSASAPEPILFLQRVAVQYLHTETPPDQTPAAIQDLPQNLDFQEGNLLLAQYPFIQQAVQSARPVVVHSGEFLPGDLASPQAYMSRRHLQGLALIPLMVKAQTIGLVELQARQAALSLDEAQLNLMMTLANAAAVALENARLYEQQLKTAEQLREVDKLKSQFLANMSHELRTPLNSIIGFSRVILKGIDGPVTDLQQQDLIAIHSAGNHLLQLITDILDISKIEAGKMELVFDHRVSLGDLAASAMSTAVGLTKDKPIRLVKRIEPDLPLVKADPTRIRQVMINFLSNAAKFTDEGTITVTVTKMEITRCNELGIPPSDTGWVCVQVTDTGPGISKLDQTKLFLPFSQVDSSSTRKVGGTGLGLSISRLLIEMHNGCIGVESDVGRGATFYFCLPALPPEEEHAENDEDAGAGEGG